MKFEYHISPLRRPFVYLLGTPIVAVFSFIAFHAFSWVAIPFLIIVPASVLITLLAQTDVVRVEGNGDLTIGSGLSETTIPAATITNVTSEVNPRNGQCYLMVRTTGLSIPLYPPRCLHEEMMKNLNSVYSIQSP